MSELGPPKGMSLGEWVLSEGPSPRITIPAKSPQLSPADRYRLRHEQDFATEENLAPFVEKEIDLIYELPFLFEQITAVYFLFYSVELIYVGASKNVAGRIADYQRAKKFGPRKSEWTRIGILPVPEQILFSVERHYIERFRPIYNRL